MAYAETGKIRSAAKSATSRRTRKSRWRNDKKKPGKTEAGYPKHRQQQAGTQHALQHPAHLAPHRLPRGIHDLADDLVVLRQ